MYAINKNDLAAITMQAFPLNEINNIYEVYNIYSDRLYCQTLRLSLAYLYGVISFIGFLCPLLSCVLC